MNHWVKSFGLVLVLSTGAAAAKPHKKWDYKKLTVPEISEVSFNDPEFMKQKKEWNKLKRKLASASSFNGGDLSGDFKKLRDEWLKCNSGDQMEALLKKSHAHYNEYSSDAKYFLAQMHTALPFRGIVWRLRPLFENNKGFLGNKSTHVTAVQAVRGSVTALKMFLPTAQTDSAIEYFTEPSKSMSKADQFQSIPEFQKFLVEEVIPVLADATSKIVALGQASPNQVYVWDNKMAFGRGSFEDDIQRFVGNGPAEVNIAIASLYRAQHNILVYSAYNQDYSIKLAGEMGSHFGVDSSLFSSKKKDFGMTDQERVALIRKATDKKHFLELRNYEGSEYGSKLMKQAYKALKNSVVYSERSFEYLQGRESTHGMKLNPVLFQQEISPNLEKGIKNMKAVVSSTAEVRDPVTGDTVALNLPAFYQEPPSSLSVLLPTQFESGSVMKTIKNNQGETLTVRNYLHGRSIAWDNSAWKKYVPSAEGKDPQYMSEARRIVQYSFGTDMVFGVPGMFVH